MVTKWEDACCTDLWSITCDGVGEKEIFSAKLLTALRLVGPTYGYGLWFAITAPATSFVISSLFGYGYLLMSDSYGIWWLECIWVLYWWLKCATKCLSMRWFWCGIFTKERDDYSHSPPMQARNLIFVVILGFNIFIGKWYFDTPWTLLWHPREHYFDTPLGTKPN